MNPTMQIQKFLNFSSEASGNSGKHKNVNRKRLKFSSIMTLIFFTLSLLYPLTELHAARESFTTLSQVRQEAFRKYADGDITFKQYIKTLQDFHRFQALNSGSEVPHESQPRESRIELPEPDLTNRENSVTDLGQFKSQNREEVESAIGSVPAGKNSAQEITTDATPDSLTSESGGELSDYYQKLRESQTSSERMSTLEKVLWGVAKTILPTLAMIGGMALLTTLGVVTGGAALIVAAALFSAAASGAMTYAYEKRSNKFRGRKKTKKEIMRDSGIAALKGGLMGVINSFIPGVGNLVSGSVAKVVVRAGFQATGSLGVNVIAGKLKNVTNRHYLKYDKSLKSNEVRMSQLARKFDHGVATEAEKAELVRLYDENEYIKNQYYQKKDLKQDIIGSVLHFGLMGVGGGVSSHFGSKTGLARKMSVRLFNSTRQSKAISRMVTDMPWAFGHGVSRAFVKKKYLEKEITGLEQRQSRYGSKSAMSQLFAETLHQKENQVNNIDYMKAGITGMQDRFTANAQGLAINLAQYRFLDAPRARKAEVRRQIVSADKKVQSQMAKLERHNSREPKRSAFTDPEKYRQTHRVWANKQATLNDDLTRSEVRAYSRASSNPARLKQLYKQYDDGLAREKRLSLARIDGDKSYIKQLAAEMSKDPAHSTKSQSQLLQTARKRLKSDRLEKEAALKAKVEEMDKMISAVNKAKKSGGELDAKEWDLLTDKALTLRPSEYKRVLMDYKVNQLRLKGASESQINSALGQIEKETQQMSLEKFGGYSEIYKREVIATKLNSTHYMDYDEKNKLIKDVTRKLNQRAAKKAVGLIWKDLKTRLFRRNLFSAKK